MKCKLLFPVAFLLLTSLLWAPLNFAQGQITSPTTAEIFKQFSEQVVKIEVVENGSGAKASVGIAPLPGGAAFSLGLTF